MEFLLIGESKIKIVLSHAEARGFNLFGNEISGPEGRRGFWRLIGLARERVGFDPKGDKLLIQLYPTGEGLEIFVTKLGILPDSSARLVSRSDRVTLLSKTRSIYSFASLDDLTSASRAIRESVGELSLQSDVYLLGETYYLSIEEYGKGGDTVEFPSILEFSTHITAELSAYILEHAARLTCGDGIEKFAML